MNEYQKTLMSQQDRGATAVEYALIIGLIAAVIIVTVTQLSAMAMPICQARDISGMNSWEKIPAKRM